MCHLISWGEENRFLFFCRSSFLPWKLWLHKARAPLFPRGEGVGGGAGGGGWRWFHVIFGWSLTSNFDRPNPCARSCARWVTVADCVALLCAFRRHRYSDSFILLRHGSGSGKRQRRRGGESAQGGRVRRPGISSGRKVGGKTRGHGERKSRRLA